LLEIRVNDRQKVGKMGVILVETETGFSVAGLNLRFSFISLMTWNKIMKILIKMIYA
jgi:hypothetical protein